MDTFLATGIFLITLFWIMVYKILMLKYTIKDLVHAKNKLKEDIRDLKLRLRSRGI